MAGSIRKGQFDLKPRGHRLTLVIDETMARHLCNCIEDDVLDGIDIPPELYKMAERINAHYFPGTYFGQQKAA